MAIDRVSGSGGFGRPEKLGQSQQSTGKPRTARGDAGDRVELSPEARQAAALADKARSLPEVRQPLVEALRKEIAEGLYEPDPRKVAQAILEYEDGLER
jgi:negative regulator of flagellin synthesis FlgM